MIVWMSRSIAETCTEEASHKFPLETGGTFMGWWANRDTAVITGMIGAGPRAHHGQNSFQPDETWQLDQIARHYYNSGRRETYLGDWHSHPNASSGTLSWIDRRVLRRIIRTTSARCPNPLMIVIWGEDENWNVNTWCAWLRPRPFLWDELVVQHAMLSML